MVHGNDCANSRRFLPFGCRFSFRVVVSGSLFRVSMSQTFEQQIARIRERLVDMSGLAQESLARALDALRERSVTKADDVEAADGEIDDLEVVIDEMVVTYIATHGPMATDCRLMLVVSKINMNLERVGDLSVSIARRARELAREPAFPPFADIPYMGDLAKQLLSDAIGCFTSGSYELAQEIVKRDKRVDDLRRALVDQLVAVMARDPSMVVRASKLIDIVRSIERIADHAKSIAEQTYYLFNARDIRHERAV